MFSAFHRCLKFCSALWLVLTVLLCSEKQCSGEGVINFLVVLYFVLSGSILLTQ